MREPVDGTRARAAHGGWTLDRGEYQVAGNTFGACRIFGGSGDVRAAASARGPRESILRRAGARLPIAFAAARSRRSAELSAELEERLAAGPGFVLGRRAAWRDDDVSPPLSAGDVTV